MKLGKQHIEKSLSFPTEFFDNIYPYPIRANCQYFHEITSSWTARLLDLTGETLHITRQSNCFVEISRMLTAGKLKKMKTKTVWTAATVIFNPVKLEIVDWEITFSGVFPVPWFLSVWASSEWQNTTVLTVKFSWESTKAGREKPASEDCNEWWYLQHSKILEVYYKF